MAEIKFSCPSCNQSIKCDELWAGHQIQCPSCQQNLTVPQVQAAPAPAPAPAPKPARVAAFQPRGSAAPGPPPPPTGQSRLALGQTSAPGASKTGPVYRNYMANKPKKSGGLMNWVGIAVLVIALGIGGYFGYGWFKDYRAKANENAAAAGNEPDGGPVAGPTAPVPGRSDSAGSVPAENAPPEGSTPKVPATELPVIPAVWTLDLNAAKIPEGRANGKISGTNFVVQTARLDYVGATPVLSLREGAGPSPDREILVYLRLKAGEQLSAHTCTVTKDMKGPSVPQVAKRWKTNPKFAPKLQRFATGYAMKLELGQINEGEVTGKIFVALPDPEQSVVAGIFTAATGSPGSGTPTVTDPVTPPNVPPTPNPEFEKRYGIRR